MTMLDRPIWNSLVHTHTALSTGDDQVRRFLPDVNMFVSGADDRPETMARLADLISPGEACYILQVPDIAVPDALVLLKQARGVQMVYQNADLSAHLEDDIIPLGDADAPEMVDLATLTEPGPFLARTHEMGRFWGVRIDGRLAAMAGERMRFPGYTEVSGVCSHPDFRGRGLARRLSAKVAREVLARGDTPFLHAWKTNDAAIGLYESLGFKLRCEVDAAVLQKLAA